MNFGPLEYAAYLRRKRDKQRESLVYQAISESGVDETNNVFIKPAPLPVVLVLTSDHEVLWQLTVAPGADLCAVLLMGVGRSSVRGAGSAQVSFIGGPGSALDPAELQRLESEVLGRLGLRIGEVQCVRGGSSFEIGGD